MTGCLAKRASPKSELFPVGLGKRGEGGACARRDARELRLDLSLLLDWTCALVCASGGRMEVVLPIIASSYVCVYSVLRCRSCIRLMTFISTSRLDDLPAEASKRAHTAENGQPQRQ